MSYQRTANLVFTAIVGISAILFIIFSVVHYHAGTPDQYFIGFIILSTLLAGFFLVNLLDLFGKVPLYIKERKSWSFITICITIAVACIQFGLLVFSHKIIFLQLFVFVLALIFLGFIFYRYAAPFFNPLSDDERSDPLEREIVINIPYDETFDLCELALHQIIIWTIQTIDKKNGKLDAWPWTSHVSLSIECIDAGQTRVHIRSVFNGGYTRFPEIEQRRNIRNVETIMAYLKKGVRIHGNNPLKSWDGNNELGFSPRHQHHGREDLRKIGRVRLAGEQE